MCSTIIIDNNSNEFIQRIMKQNRWSLEYTNRVINEYKKFIYLGLLHSVEPSWEIDQVWHTHLLYTKDYQKMCNRLNITFFHHNPKSSKLKYDKYNDGYQFTKELYQEMYGEIPPEDIWTNWKPSNYIYIDTKNYHIIKKDNISHIIKLLIKQLKNKINGLIQLFI